jgi:hypothetical protein
MTKDAWEQESDLRRQYSKNWVFRNDLRVTADGLDRTVWINSTRHIVRTVHEYVSILEEACRFVESANPEWAKRNLATISPPPPSSPPVDIEFLRDTLSAIHRKSTWWNLHQYYLSELQTVLKDISALSEAALSELPAVEAD